LKLLVAGKLVIHIKKNESRLLSPVAKIKSKLTKYLHVKFDTMKLLEENSEEMHVDIRMGKEFLRQGTKSTGGESKNRKMGLLHNIKLLHTKESVITMKTKFVECERIFTNYTYVQLMCRI
jgi:hypothetical protein